VGCLFFAVQDAGVAIAQEAEASTRDEKTTQSSDISVLETDREARCGRGPVEDENTTITEARRLIRANEAQRAVNLLMGYLREEPTDLDARVALASAQSAAGRRREARQSIDRVLSEQPRNVDALLLRGILDQRDRRWTQAEAAFREVIARSPRYCDAYVLLARQLMRRNDLAGARAVLSSIDECCADNKEILSVQRQLSEKN
jgi:thioredoxin-like negative regulator of GroEL